MTKIHLLSPDLVAKIAAGEVVERPAYAIKELVENSVDAGADYIRIDIEKSGLQKITITDNGEGMSGEDIKLCYQSHTTSKISAESDLQAIKCMGFRGEALASIAAISNLTIRSKTAAQKAGTEVELTAGKVEDISPVGMPAGTSISVENLFYTVPARQKFLKSPQTEFRISLQIISNIALAYPQIRFFVTHNKKTVLDLPKNQNILERVKELLGESTFKNLVPVSVEDSYISLSGFIAKPQLSTHSPQKQYVFINGRTVRSKLISSTVKDTYGTLLEPDAYPIFIFSLKTPYEMVDVNVHPRKEEVAFHNDKLITSAVSTAVTNALNENNLTFYDNRWQKSKRNKSDILQIRDGGTSTYAAEILKQELPKKTKISKSADIIQLHNLYLITETENGFLMIDQHAAHERILYEKLKRSFESKRKQPEKFTLLVPLELELSITDQETLDEHKNIFAELGFIIDDNRVVEVPELFHDRNIEELITEMIDDLAEGKEIHNLDVRSERMLSYLACRSAIKAGDKITKEQAKEICSQLATCQNQYTCPHGRPTQIEITSDELAKLFMRK